MKIEANENGIQGICSQFPPAKKPRDKQEVLDVLYSPPPRSCDTQQLKRVLILNGGLQIIGIIVRSDVSVFTRMEGLRQQSLSIVWDSTKYWTNFGRKCKHFGIYTPQNFPSIAMETHFNIE